MKRQTNLIVSVKIKFNDLRLVKDTDKRRFVDNMCCGCFVLEKLECLCLICVHDGRSIVVQRGHVNESFDVSNPMHPKLQKDQNPCYTNWSFCSQKCDNEQTRTTFEEVDQQE